MGSSLLRIFYTFFNGNLYFEEVHYEDRTVKSYEGKHMGDADEG